jgi:hypothetical protein
VKDDYSKEFKPVPRTIQQAFGPYHRFDIAVCKRYERLCAIVGVIVLGMIYGIMFWWRG